MTIPQDKVAMENVLPRPDARKKVTGAARYGMDVYLPGMLHVLTIRFPYGTGRVRRSNKAAAESVPGVVEVSFDEGAEPRYCGERLGYIAAETPQAAGDALAALNPQYVAGNPDSDPEALWDGPGELSTPEKEKLDQLYERAAGVVEAVYRTQVQTHSSFETHGAVAHHKGDTMEVWASTQGVSGYPGGLTNVSGLDAGAITVHSDYVGGGFGSKFGPGYEGTLAARLSRRHNRPVRVYLDRRGEHLDAGNRPGSIQYMKLAVDSDGKILGGHLDLASIVGYTGRGGGVRNPSYYNFGDVVRKEQTLALNAGAPRAFRAPAYPQGAFAVESMMDELAATIGMDPVEFRKKNELSRRRVAQYDIGMEMIGWKDRRPDGTWPGRVKTGFGVGASSWGNSQGQCEVDLDIHRDGHIEVRVGVQDIGTGTSTIIIDVVADHLGIDREKIVGKVGKSSYPPGPASGGSVVSRFTAPALRDAAEKGLERLKEIVAQEWSVDPSSVEWRDGAFHAGSQESSWDDAAALMTSEKVGVRGRFNAEYFGSGNSDCVQFVKLDVDTETGIVVLRKVVAIHCCGKVINRLTALNQVKGGVIQGISYALFEDRILDIPTGGMVNPDLLYYKIAGTMDVPEIVAHFDVREGEDGVRALGEPTTVPTCGAVANAIANATGARVRSMPMTPQRILEALDQKGGST